jgi:hypothetical protein
MGFIEIQHTRDFSHSMRVLPCTPLETLVRITLPVVWEWAELTRASGIILRRTSRGIGQPDRPRRGRGLPPRAPGRCPRGGAGELEVIFDVQGPFSGHLGKPVAR